LATLGYQPPGRQRYSQEHLNLAVLGETNNNMIVLAPNTNFKNEDGCTVVHTFLRQISSLVQRQSETVNKRGFRDLMRSWAERFSTKFPVIDDQTTAEMNCSGLEISANDHKRFVVVQEIPWLMEAALFLFDQAIFDEMMSQAMVSILGLTSQDQLEDPNVRETKQTAFVLYFGKNLIPLGDFANLRKQKFRETFGQNATSSSLNEMGKKYLVSLVSQMIVFVMGFGVDRFEAFINNRGQVQGILYQNEPGEKKPILHFCNGTEHVLFPKLSELKELDSESVTKWFSEVPPETFVHSPEEVSA